MAILAVAAPGSSAKVTYEDDIFPIFETSCLNCHNPDKKKWFFGVCHEHECVKLTDLYLGPLE